MLPIFRFLSDISHKLIGVFKNNIRYKLFFVYLVAILAPIIAFGFLSYKISSNVINSDFEKYKDRINTQIVKNIDENIKNLERQSMGIYANMDDIVNIVSTPVSDINTSYIESSTKTKNYFNSIIQGNNNIKGISLISLQGEIKLYISDDFPVLNLKTVNDQPWFKEAVKSKGQAIFLEPHFNEFLTQDEKDRKPVVSVLRAIIDLNRNQVCGLLLIDQNVEYLSEILSKVEMESGEIISVFGKTGDVIYANKGLDKADYQRLYTFTKTQKAGLREVDLSGVPMLVSCRQSDKLGWKVVSALPLSDIEGKSSFLKDINITLLIILAVFIFIISIFVSYFITKPLTKLTESFKKVQKGDFNASVAIHGGDELAQIGETFNSMVCSIKNLIEQKYELGILRKQAELEALQSQINPHFLFNTLNSIKTVADKRDYDKVPVMVQDLSDIFRYCLNKGKYVVRFGDELEHIRKYLFLQKCRFYDKYEVKFDIPDEVLSYNIPRLTLQPIVENALYHGLERKVGKGELLIAAQAVNGMFYIYISDNGVGIQEKELAEINAALENAPENQSSLPVEKLGICNVNARIKFIFGNGYGISVFSIPGKKTTVRITLPASQFIESGQ